MSRLRFILAGIFLLFSFGLFVLSFDSASGKYLRVDFLDVGQGDSILITSPSGAQALIDAGKDTSVLRSIAKVLPFSDRKIDVLIATHPDADHVGGFPKILDRFEIENIIGLNSKSESAIFQSFLSKSKEEGANLIEARRGTLIDLGEGVFIQILFPYESTLITGNDSSVIVKIIYGETEILLTGDAGSSVERHLIDIENELLQSEILKLGHHGSKTSSSLEFLEAVNPSISVISAGRDNSYGHPHEGVIENLNSQNIPFLGTYQEGTITFLSDGEKFWRK